MKTRTIINTWLLCVLTVIAAVAFWGCGQAEYGKDKGSGYSDRTSQASPEAREAYKDAKGEAGAMQPLAANTSARSAIEPDSAPPRGAVSLTQPGEELWVIAKPATRVARDPANDKDETPGSGAMVTEIPVDPQQPDGRTQRVPLPLKHTDVKARVDAYIATVEVTQQFHNPYSGKIEAVYVFPLPQDAAVNEFVMTIGARKIRGIIREKEEAERIYYAARDAGHNAALLTQQRPNIFTQRVANIEPGKAIDINVKYFNTLPYHDGWYTFSFPMVVGPRFNPPHTAATGDGIGAVGRGNSGLSGQKTEVSYLRPSERSGHDIALSVELNPGVAIEEMICKSHQIKHSPLNDSTVRVAIDPADTIPNKDFVLHFRVTGDRVKSNMLVQRDERGGFFTLMLYPPAELKHLPRRPMEMVFVLDCSGSMSGYPINKAKSAIRHALRNMDGRDTFQIIQFSNNASALGARPLAVTGENVQRALQYVDGLHGSGGTHMIEGIKAALDFPQSEGRQRVVAFMTDGYIGNETEILGEIHDRLNGARIFSFGVGSSVNTYLMERMAKLGRGAVAYVGPNDDEKAIVSHFFDRVAHPALADIELEFGSMQAHGLFPKRVPDLFVGRPVLLVGRFEGEAPTEVQVRGRAANEAIALTVPVKSLEHRGGNVVNGAVVGGIPAVWARTQIADLADQMTHTKDPHGELPTQIKQLALDYNLMSAYTAFVAVDSSRVTEGDTGTTVPVPVPVPDGVKYETTVKGERGG